MKISVVVTVFNEEKSVGKLLKSLLGQTKKPDEIVIVDGGSADKTVEIIRHFQKKDKKIKLLKEKCSRARGRNLGIEVAKNDFIAIIDAGCTADKNWLKRITEPFKNKEVDIAAGFYKMLGETPFQKALSVFLGVLPPKFDVNFLPSARSMAFRRGLWQGIGGFPERLEDTAEDTVFNYKAIKFGAKFARVKNAIVYWKLPKTYNEALKKLYTYAKGDARAGIWWHPTQKLASHNIRIVSIFLRYFAGLALLILAFQHPLFWSVLILGLIFYSFWAFRKVFVEFSDWKAGLWGIVLQFSSDFAVMIGFLKGALIFPRYTNRHT